MHNSRIAGESELEWVLVKVAGESRCDSQSGEFRRDGGERACVHGTGGRGGKSTKQMRSLSLMGAKAAPDRGCDWPSGWGNQGRARLYLPMPLQPRQNYHRCNDRGPEGAAGNGGGSCQVLACLGWYLCGYGYPDLTFWRSLVRRVMPPLSHDSKLCTRFRPFPTLPASTKFDQRSQRVPTLT